MMVYSDAITVTNRIELDDKYVNVCKNYKQALWFLFSLLKTCKSWLQNHKVILSL